MSQRMNDRDLRNHQLLLSDPYDQDGLVRDIPDGATLSAVINTYAYEKWPNEKAYCCVCRGHHHKRGFTALLSTGDKVMLGSKCGSDVFGEDWGAAEDRMRDAERRKYELGRLDRLEPVLSDMRSRLLGLHRHIDAMVNRRRGFESAFGDLVYYLRQASDGALFEDVRQIDHGQSDRQGRTVFTSVRRTVGRYDGASFFENYEPLPQIDRALSAMATCAESFGATDSLSTPALTRRRRALEDGFEAIERAFAFHAAGRAFFRPANIDSVIAWSNRVGLAQVRYELVNGLMTSDRGEALKLFAADPLEEELISIIRSYRRSD